MIEALPKFTYTVHTVTERVRIALQLNHLSQATTDEEGTDIIILIYI